MFITANYGGCTRVSVCLALQAAVGLRQRWEEAKRQVFDRTVIRTAINNAVEYRDHVVYCSGGLGSQCTCHR